MDSHPDEIICHTHQGPVAYGFHRMSRSRCSSGGHGGIFEFPHEGVIKIYLLTYQLMSWFDVGNQTMTNLLTIENRSSVGRRFFVGKLMRRNDFSKR